MGSAAVQLAKRRGAHVIAEDIYHFRHVRDLPEPDASRVRNEWLEQLHAAGADRVVDEGDDIAAVLGRQSVDVVVDNVGGPAFASLIEALARGGRYASSGAIAGPIVSFDKRSFYLKDLTFFGITAWDEPVFPNLVSYIERHEIRPLVARTYPLAQIADAQREFLEKKHLGKFVLVPPRAAAGGLRRRRTRWPRRHTASPARTRRDPGSAGWASAQGLWMCPDPMPGRGRPRPPGP